MTCTARGLGAWYIFSLWSLFVDNRICFSCEVHNALAYDVFCLNFVLLSISLLLPTLLHFDLTDSVVCFRLLSLLWNHSKCCPHFISENSIKLIINSTAANRHLPKVLNSY